MIELIDWLSHVNLASEVTHSNWVLCELFYLFILLFKITFSYACECTMDTKLNINSLQFKCIVLYLLIFL